MKTPINNCFKFTLICALAIGLPRDYARAADTSSYPVNKHQEFNQTDSGPAVIQNQNGGPYIFEATANASTPGLVLGLSVKLPNGASQSGAPNPPGSENYSVITNFPTLAELDAAYPAGQYVLTITNLNDGIKVVTNNLPASIYPPAPHVSNFNAAQNINSLADFTVTWDAFTNGTANDIIILQVSDTNGNKVFRSPFFTTGMLTGLSNALALPANTLTADQTYNASLEFDKIINIDTNSYPGATGYTLFFMRTYFNLQTAGGPTLTVSPSVISNTYTGVITLQIGGIPAGGEVQVQKYIDLNGDGVIETNEPLFDSFYITDNGSNGIIGGVTNVNVPIDTDPAMGAITTTLNFAAPLTLENMVGHYVYQVISSNGQATATFTVTNANTGQSVSGIIYSNGITPLPHGMVLALTAGVQDYVGAVVADSSGHYVLNLNPGAYVLVPTCPGYFTDQSLAPQVELTSDMDATNNLFLTNGTVTISGVVLGSSYTGTNTLGGVMLQFTSGNLGAFDFSDSSGTYCAGVSPNNWKVAFVRERLARRAYVVSKTTVQVSTETGSVSNLTNTVYQGNALFYGRITDNSNNPFVNIEFSGNDNSNLYSAKGFSDQNGDYAVAVLGDLGANDPWFVDGGVPNYIANSYNSANICTNQAIQQNVVCLPVTTQISGQVQELSAGFYPVVGVGLYAQTTVNGLIYNSLTMDTDASGDYTLGVASGCWQVQFLIGNGGDTLANRTLVDLNGPYCVCIPPTNATLNITVYPIGTILITQPARLSPTQFGFNVRGSLNVNYTVQVSTNLASTNWSDLQNFQLTNNPFPIVDVQATNSPRFYRVLENQ